MNLTDEIKKLINGDVLVDENILEEYAEDKSIFRIKPRVVIFPKNVSDIQNLVKLVSQKRKNNEDISLTARSAGTDMTGGPLTQSILLVFTKYFNQIIEWGKDYVVLEPGVYYRDFEKEAKRRQLFYPSYPASKEICAWGGIINNNSGGEKSLKYGKTEKYVEEIEVVLADGNVYTLKCWNQDELDKIKKQENFLSKCVVEIEKIILANRELILKSKPKVKKNSSGYNLWDIIDFENRTFNLVKLFVGAQGTLGIVTKAKVQLLDIKQYEKIITIFIKNISSLPAFVNDVLKLNPVSIEATDDHTFKIFLKYAKEMASLLGVNNIFRTLKLFLPEIKYTLTHWFPKIVLIISFEGDDEEEVERNIKQTAILAKKYNFWFRIPRDEIEANKYWKLRRDTYKLLREKIKDRLAAPTVDDIIVDPDVLPDFLPKLYKILEKYKLLYTISGHIGDGNLHIIPLMDMKREKDKIFSSMEEIYKLVIEYRGSITAEHNDGLLRTPFLELQFGKEMLNLFYQVKKIFDPLNIFNPLKKVGLDKETAAKFIRD